MPTYQYACPDCGYKFERVQRFTDDPVRVCPECSRESVYRVVSKVAITFKGSGWYITDSRQSSKAAKNGDGNGKAEGEKTADKEPAATAEKSD
ncbi:MAG: FmdB family zinc ribbon protein [Anaerolineae bacterium]|nr:hypothetical protein [Thermoflexales bacterium]MDW8395930.1 FmdB family zinc ribbon protein [Anaerolineae bacterium]